MSVCQGCGSELPPPSRKGRPRKWCSERCRKRQYAGTCVDCGAPTNGYKGPGTAGERCLSCHSTYNHDTRYWTPERIIEALRVWADEHGGIPPTASPWLYDLPLGYPPVSTVQREFGSWNAGIEAAGFTPRGHGDRLHYRNGHTGPAVAA